jgi:streptogramin lyase
MQKLPHVHGAKPTTLFKFTNVKPALLILPLLAVGLLYSTSTVHAAACTPPATDLGSVTSTLNISTSGTYRIWSRIMTGTASTDNSYLLEVDGSSCYTVGDNNAIPANTWTWVDYQNGATTTKLDISLTAGSHTIKMIGKESGVKIDRIIAASDTSCVPSGVGDNCVTTTPQPPTITKFTTPSQSPFHITKGPDGNIWFTEDTDNVIGKMTPSGTVTEYPVPTANASLRKITAGPDGNVWFTEFTKNKIGKITTSGVVTEYTIPTSSSLPVGIVTGPDGNIWFAESLSGKIGKLNPANGSITEFGPEAGISYGANPHDLIVGGDGNLWFTEYGGGDTTPARVARITTAGVVTEFDLVSNGVASDAGLHGLAWGPDGNLWFTEHNKHKIGRLNPTNGSVTEFSTGLSPESYPNSITAGPDGNLWFAETIDNIGKITPAGVITEYAVSASSQADGIVAGPDGNVWFAARGGDYVGRILLATPPAKTGDLNNDNQVNIFDLSILLSNYGKAQSQSNNAKTDLNNDGTINIFDLSILLSNYGK